MGNSIGESPTLSVVTACYNDAEYLSRCLASVKNQSYNNIEHIIVDGNSDDGTVELLHSWEKKIASESDTIEFRWISEPDDGIYEAIEKGFNLCTGDIYAWLNADDRWYPWTADIVSDVFSHTFFEWIIGHLTELDDQGRPIYTDGLRRHYKRDWIKRGWYYDNGLGYVQQESTFWTQNLWQRSGGFPDGVELAGDYWLWRQFAQETELRTVDTILGGFCRREGGDQLSQDNSKYLSEVERSLLAEVLGTFKAERIYSIIKNISTTPVCEKIREVQ